MARRKRASAGEAAFFDRFRSAIARLPAGLIRAQPGAPPDDVARASTALGRPLPEEYASFLRSFDGADLFHESVLIAGVGAGAPWVLGALAPERADEIVFAEALAGDRFALDGAGRVLRYDPGAEERALAGSSFTRWLDATVAREQILFGPDGEYAPDVFDPAGQEVVPTIALRQAERALKLDPGAADAEHARGLALARLGRREAALAAFRAATDLYADNPWPWFDLGRTALALAKPAAALPAFRRAATAAVDASTSARLLAWAARAAVASSDDAAVETLRAEARAKDPQLVEHLLRSAAEAAGESDDDARAEAVALLEAVAPGTPVPRRLPVLPH
ncbi:MAG TPA: SMI1/KNR4 family protein [Polyangia bacterium]|nr:SMI1/KNR4 family protein [Polyangia bacterium]